MQRSYWLTCTAAVIILAGCGSFNNSFNTYAPPPTKLEEGPLTSDPEAEDDASNLIPAARPDVPKVDCDQSPWPEPGTPPPYPYQLMQGAGSDLAKIERIERKHIDELRAYITERRRLNKEARAAFLTKCTMVAK